MDSPEPAEPSRPNVAWARRGRVLCIAALVLVVTWVYGVLHPPFPLAEFDEYWLLSFALFVIMIAVGSLPALLCLKGTRRAVVDPPAAVRAVCTGGVLMFVQSGAGLLFSRARGARFEHYYGSLSEPGYEWMRAGTGFTILAGVSIAVGVVGLALIVSALTSPRADPLEEA